MLKVYAPIGNVFTDKAFKHMKNDGLEVIRLSRASMQKRIIRVRGDRGTDVGISLISGLVLSHGDVIGNHSLKIIVLQMSEKVIIVTTKARSTGNMALSLLGHIIGNCHRPISVTDHCVIFPIQADSELEVFTRLFHSIIDLIDLKIESHVFRPHAGADIHEH